MESRRHSGGTAGSRARQEASKPLSLLFSIYDAYERESIHTEQANASALLAAVAESTWRKVVQGTIGQAWGGSSPPRAAQRKLASSGLGLLCARGGLWGSEVPGDAAMGFAEGSVDVGFALGWLEFTQPEALLERPPRRARCCFVL